jgi:predicted chitinase
MTEKVLPYDRSIVPQETGYWCGPAATQVVLNSRGLIVAESTLAREIGTTVNGTDYVGLIERILDLRVPDARYTSVYVERDPMTGSQKETLWRNLTRSIDAGFGVVMNWVAPPSNKPRGVNGSVSPSYSGGTTYHYVAAMGYKDDVPGLGRAVWIADSGFRPYGYWISFDQCATLIPPKGYAYADVDAPGGPAAPVDPDSLAADILLRAMGGSMPFDFYRASLPGVRRCLADCGVAFSVPRLAMWFAQVGHESVGLKYMAELWGPTAAQQGYEGRADLGNTQPGDGYRFRGSGPIQVTGRHNFTVLSQWAFSKGLVPTPTFFVDNPDELRGLANGFIGVTWYWTTQRLMNEASDARDLERATRYVNGGLNGLDNRRLRYNNALAMGSELLKIVTLTDPIEEFLMSDVELESISIYATPGEPKIPLARLLQNIDAALHRFAIVEPDARLGDADALMRLARTADGRGKFKDAGTVAHAKAVLLEIANKNPEFFKKD